MKKFLALFLGILVTGCASSGDKGAVTTQPTAIFSESPSIKVGDIELAKELISELFYNDQVASTKTFEEFLDFQLSNTYPGSVNKEIATKCVTDSQILIPYGVPDLDTVRLDSDWVFPVSSDADIDLGGPPEGETYIVAAENSLGKSQVHVTILDGVPYYFPLFCRL